jgi:tRNA (guanine37-N1)-methyltransferase
MFPEMFHSFMETGVIGKVLQGQRTTLNLEIHLVQIRDYSPEGFKGIDDSPYGGGPGMVMRPDVLALALEKGVFDHYPQLDKNKFKNHFDIIYTGPRGRLWNHQTALEFSQKKFNLETREEAKDLIFLCGRYEGVDERFLTTYVNEEYSIGDYVLSGGELAVMAILDSALRLVPGTLGNQMGALSDSFCHGLLEHPQYTRPPVFQGIEVPAILMSGNHQQILEYRQQLKINCTQKYRPDLWKIYLASKGED